VDGRDVQVFARYAAPCDEEGGLLGVRESDTASVTPLFTLAYPLPPTRARPLESSERPPGEPMVLDELLEAYTLAPAAVGVPGDSCSVPILDAFGVVAARTSALLPRVLPPDPTMALGCLGEPSLPTGEFAPAVSTAARLTRALARGCIGVAVAGRTVGDDLVMGDG
jgi:hypothetical protein